MLLFAVLGYRLLQDSTLPRAVGLRTLMARQTLLAADTTANTSAPAIMPATALEQGRHNHRHHTQPLRAALRNAFNPMMQRRYTVGQDTAADHEHC